MPSPQKTSTGVATLPIVSEANWLVDVVAAIPQSIMPMTGTNATATSRYWNASAVPRNDTCVIRVWYASPQQDLASHKFHAPVLELTHPRLSNDDTVPLLLSFSRTHESLYASQANAIYWWKLHPSLLTRRVPPATTAVLLIDLEDDEVVSCIDVFGTFLAVGTSQGRAFWITQTHVPPTMSAHPMQSSSSSSLWQRLLIGSYPTQASPLARVLILNETTVVTVAETGQINQWTSRTQSKSHHVTSILQKHGVDGFQLVQVVNACQHDATVVHIIATIVTNQNEQRWYWIKFDTKLNSTFVAWLNRFTNDTDVVGMVANESQQAYAFLTQNTRMVIVCSFMEQDQLVVEEVDVNYKPLAVCPDIKTHGCFILTSSGEGLLAEHVPTQEIETAPSQKSQRTVQLLATHLRAIFADYYQEGGDIRVPPSLQTADVADLEAAVEQVAHHTSTRSSLEPHLAFLEWLQEAGLYRRLSNHTKWKLFSIGQELAVLGALMTLPRQDSWEDRQLGQLSSSVVEWWQAIPTEERSETLSQWLGTIIQVATSFREERSHATYFIDKHRPPTVESVENVPIWTTQLLPALEEQLLIWRSEPASVQFNVIETILRGLMQAAKDMFLSCPNANTRQHCARLQRKVIQYLRPEKDLLAFELSAQHGYLDGVCQIAFDHETKGDASSFSLEELLGKHSDTLKDVGIDLELGIYVLQWHLERGYYGHVLRYGKYAPAALGLMMKREEALQPYQWIYAVQAGDYDQATESLVASAEDEDRSLPDVRFALCVANLTNKVVEGESISLREKATKRRKYIDARRELVGVQEELLGVESCASSPVWPPERLVTYALDEVDSVEDKGDRVDRLFLALLVCASAQSIDFKVKSAQEVWAKAIVNDMVLWERLIRDEENLASHQVRKIARSESVFGQLVQQVEDQISIDVHFCGDVEIGALQRIGTDIALPLQRILHSAMKNEDSHY